MKTVSYCIALLLLGGSAALAADYQLEVTIDLDSFSLQGSGTVRLDATPADGQLHLHRSTSPALELIRLYVNGEELPFTVDASGYSTRLAGTSGPLSIEFDWRIAELPESGGIILLDDYQGASWYPRLAGRMNSSISATVSLMGSGHIATSGVTESREDMGGMSEYSFADENQLILAVSPIFVEQRSFADLTSVGIFMREGADSWKNRVAGIAAEIINFYQSAIPGFEPGQIDIVFADAELAGEIAIPGIAIVADVIDAYVADYGAVYTANQLRFQLAVRIAGAWFADVIKTPENGIPWLSHGLTYLYAQEYAREILLGGPAFDMVRQRYLSALESSAELSLAQSATQADVLLETLSESKGFWVASMLRRQIGPVAFNSLIRELNNREEAVTLTDIEQLASAAAGVDLSSFLQTWAIGDSRFDLAIEKAELNQNGADVTITNPLNIPVTVAIDLALESGETVRQQQTLQPGTSQLALEAGQPMRRIRFDPDSEYPDPRRSNNVRSFGGTAAIDQLYAIDNSFVIGDVEMTSEPLKIIDQRAADFRTTISNKRDRAINLGIHLTTSFPKVRNRGISKIFVQLSPGETQTIEDMLFMPLRGSGAMEVKVEYFVVADREQFEAINRRSRPNLVSWFMMLVE